MCIWCAVAVSGDDLVSSSLSLIDFRHPEASTTSTDTEQQHNSLICKYAPPLQIYRAALWSNLETSTASTDRYRAAALLSNVEASTWWAQIGTQECFWYHLMTPKNFYCALPLQISRAALWSNLEASTTSAETEQHYGLIWWLGSTNAGSTTIWDMGAYFTFFFCQPKVVSKGKQSVSKYVESKKIKTCNWKL